MNDQQARDKIINDLDANFIVNAGAGSGKTHSLVQRIFSLIQNKGIPPEQIVVITFTNKAAAELKERILEKAGSKEMSINNMFIGTIHSFCTEILKEFPVESKVDINFKTLDQVDTDILQEQVWIDFLDKIYLNYKEDILFLEQHNIHIDNYKDAYKTICKYPDIEFPVDDLDFPDLTETMQKINAFMEEITPHLPEDQPDKFTQVVLNCKFVITRLDWVIQNGTYSALLQLEKLTKSKTPAIKITKWPNKDFAKKLRDEDLPKFIQSTVTPILDQARAHCYARIIKILTVAANQFHEHKNNMGCVDFTDLLMKTSHILQNKTYIRKYLQTKYKHIFVDEFQDTDPLQSKIIFYLTSSDFEEKNWHKCKPKQGSLFIVGDPKQSIYRFRRADITLYNKVKEIVVAGGGEELILNTNFRSAPEVLNWINNAFVDFTSLEAYHKDKPGTIKKISSTDLKTKSDDLVKQEAKTIAQYILTQVKTNKKKYSDFMLIAYNKNRLEEYMNILDNHGIPCMIAGDEKTIYSVLLWDINRLFRFLDNMFDETLFYGVLRGMFFGYTDEELFSNVIDRVIPNIPLLDYPGKPGNDNLFKNYRKLFDQYSPACAFEKILVDIGAFEVASFMKNPKKELNYLENLLLRVKSNEFKEYTNLEELCTYLNKLIFFGKLSRNTVQETNINSVVLMNLHQSKGLESPVVILINPTGKNRNTQPQVCISRQGNDEYAYIAMPGAQPLNWDKYCEQEIQQLHAEHKRLLYVAATRAKDELVVTYSEKTGNNWMNFNQFLVESESI